MILPKLIMFIYILFIIQHSVLLSTPTKNQECYYKATHKAKHSDFNYDLFVPLTTSLLQN